MRHRIRTTDRTRSQQNRHRGIPPLRSQAHMPTPQKDADFYNANRGIVIHTAELLSKAKFLTNTLRGNSKLSSFELARGYQPAIIGLPQTNVSKDLLNAYHKQIDHRGICKLLESRSPKLIKPSLLPRQTPEDIGLSPSPSLLVERSKLE